MHTNSTKFNSSMLSAGLRGSMQTSPKVRLYVNQQLDLATARAASCDGRVHLFVCLSPNCKNAIFSKTKQFRAMVSY